MSSTVATATAACGILTARRTDNTFMDVHGVTILALTKLDRLPVFLLSRRPSPRVIKQVFQLIGPVANGGIIRWTVATATAAPGILTARRTISGFMDAQARNIPVRRTGTHRQAVSPMIGPALRVIMTRWTVVIATVAPGIPTAKWMDNTFMDVRVKTTPALITLGRPPAKRRVIS